MIPSDNKNLLLYGENGVGKSSLYEAIKVIFFKEKLESKIIATTPEDQVQQRLDFWSSYNNKIDNHDFDIEVNDIPYSSFAKDEYQVFMISLEELKVEDKISLRDLIEKFKFSIEDIPK